MEKTISSKQIFLIPLCLVFLTTLGSGYIYFGSYSVDKLYLSLLFKLSLIILTIVLIVKYRSFIQCKFRENIFTFLGSLFLLFISVNDVHKTILVANYAVSTKDHFTFLCNVFATGVFEELLFRVLLFYLILTKYPDKWKSVLITSFIFSLAHFSNLLNPDVVKISILNQVVFAFGIGVLLQTLLLRFKSLFLIITLHSLLNYFGSYKRILLHQEQAIQNDYSSTTFLPSLFFTLILNSILIFVAYQLISSQLKTGKTLRY